MSERSSKRDNDVVTPDSYITFGNHQSQSGNYLGALAAYDCAVRLDPSYARSYNYRGSFKYASLGDIQGALFDFDLAVRYDPDYAVAYAIGRTSVDWHIDRAKSALCLIDRELFKFRGGEIFENCQRIKNCSAKLTP